MATSPDPPPPLGSIEGPLLLPPFKAPDLVQIHCDAFWDDVKYLNGDNMMPWDKCFFSL